MRNAIASHVSNIRYVVGLDDFQVYIDSMEDKSTKSVHELITLMSIDVRYDYIYAYISCNEKEVERLWENKSYFDIIMALCHELAHIITGELTSEIKVPYRGRGRILEERLTERVGRLIHRVYSNFMKECNVDIKTGLIKHERKQKR